MAKMAQRANQDEKILENIFKETFLWFMMAKNYAEEAKRLEKAALLKKNASRSMKDIPRRKILLEQVARLYETAVRDWALEAKQNSTYPRKERYARLNAINDYGLAKKIREEINEIGLERQVFGIVSIISFLGALFFISFNLTGNSIGNLNNENLSLYWIGTGLFVLGLVFAFMFFKNKKR